MFAIESARTPRGPRRLLRAPPGVLPALLVTAVAACFPGTASAQLNLLSPTFANLSGASVWSSLGTRARVSPGSDERPLWRWGFAAFYGPFGGSGDTVVTFTQTVSDSADSAGTAGPAARSARTRTTHWFRGESRRLGGGKVTLVAGYQHSPLYRFGSASLPDAVPVGGIFVASLLGPYPLAASRRLTWSGGVGGTIVRLSSLALRADTVGVELTTERTFAPEALFMLMYGPAQNYRIYLGASYQYLRFSSLSYRAMQPGDRIPAAILRGLPRALELQSVHVSLGFSFAASGLLPGR